MEITHINIANHSRIQDVDLEVRGHMVIVGANDVGKTSILRICNLVLGGAAQLYQSLSPSDVRDPDAPLVADIRFGNFSEEERRVFYREIDVDPKNRGESLDVRLEVSVDPEDDQSVLITRWCPGRGEIRPVSREQIAAIGWRFLPAHRATNAGQFEGPNSAVQVLLHAVEPDLGDAREKLENLQGEFHKQLEASAALSSLRGEMAEHLSSAMPRPIEPDDLAIRSAARDDSVLGNVGMFLARGDEFVPFAEQSDGMRQLVSMTLFDLAEGAANVVALDEPELHLHPSSQRTVASLLTREVNQKVVVTHSPYIVQRFDPTQVVAVSPSGKTHQLDPKKTTVEERAHAHWWSPRMLEALTARTVIIVEGVADRIIVEGVSRAMGISLDRIGAMVFELGGAENFPSVYKLLGPTGFDVRVLGLVDEKESPRWIGAVGGRPKKVVDSTVFISSADLEEEYCEGLGAEWVARALIASGVAREDGILSSCKAGSLGDLSPAALAEFCRSSAPTGNRKIPSALAVVNSLDDSTAARVASVARLVRRLNDLHRSDYQAELP